MPSEQKTISFRIEYSLHERLTKMTEKLGLNASRVFRDALTEKMDQLEALALLADSLKKK